MNSLVASNLTHHPGRTAVSIIGVGVGVVLVVLTVGLVHGMLRERARRDANIGVELMVGRQGQGISFTSSDLSLPVSDVAALKQVEGVALVTPVGQHLEMKGDNGLGLRQIDGVEFATFQPAASLKIIEGESLPASGYVAIVDVKYAADHKTHIGDNLVGFGRDLKIIGVYEPECGSRIKVPLSTMQDALSADGKCSMLYVKCSSPDQQEIVARRILDRFPEYRVIFVRDLPEMFATGFSAINVFLNLVAALATVISLLIILLTMYTTVAERTRQIGILKSLGASKWFIALAIEKEALLISVLGIIGGLLVAVVARALLVRLLGWKIELEMNYIIFASVAGLISGAIGALYPAMRAASQDPVEALSYE
jgi:putative ABC transport system permease protein